MNTTILLSAQAAQQGSAWPMLLMMVAIFVIMWLFMIRPQQKKAEGNTCFSKLFGSRSNGRNRRRYLWNSKAYRSRNRKNRN